MPVDVTMDDGSHFTAERILQVLSPHDPEGEKTYFVAQIDGVRRRLDHTRVVLAHVQVPEDECPTPQTPLPAIGADAPSPTSGPPTGPA